MEYKNKRLFITFDTNDSEQAENLGIKYPLYFQYYGDALKSVLNNIEENALTGLKNVEERDGNSAVGDRPPLYASNVIAFIGNRGTGKTTAITEFAHILESDDRRQEWNQEINCQNDLAKSSKFRVLPLIDASMLSEKDDLVEVILASMYHIVDDERRNYKQKNPERDNRFRNIIVAFDEVYKEYLNVGNLGDQNIFDDSVLVKLRNVSDSLKLKASIERLTTDFLELLEDGRTIDNRSYMVVLVDDLDMNPRSGFKMLDQLYKYFSNRNVIVLVALRYEQMYLLSQKNFVDGLIPEYGSTHDDVYNKYEGEARKLANDYLLKALPLVNRIYLPERDKLYLEANVEQKGFGKFQVKEFLLKKIADKTGIYYDGMGLKKHFCLPDTVRELVTYVTFLDSLESLDVIEQKENAASDRQMKLYDQNHERFNKDIETRMAMEILDDEQLALYQLIMERHIERRAGYMLCFIRNWIENGELHDSVDALDFCYTDLIKILYDLGRKNYGDKPLVHCILASFTSEMVREHYSYRHNKNKDARGRAKKRLQNFLGTTFGGEWIEEAMPKVFMEVGNKYAASLRAGYIKHMAAWNFEIQVKGLKYQWDGLENWLPDILSDNLPYVECISLLLVNAKDETGRLVSPEWKFQIDKREETEEGTQAVLTVVGHVVNADFDMFGFLGREIKAEEVSRYDEKLFEALKSCAVDYCDKNNEETAKEDICKKLEQQAKKKSIWNTRQEGLTFPYYDFDMAYNVVKRVRKKMAGDASSISAGQICEYYRKVYGYMAHYLQEEEQYYQKLFGENGRHGIPQLYADFINSPFIKAFGAQYNNKKMGKTGTLDEKMLNHYLLNTIKNLTLDVSGEEGSPD